MEDLSKNRNYCTTALMDLNKNVIKIRYSSKRKCWRRTKLGLGITLPRALSSKQGQAKDVTMVWAAGHA